jgi:hypothetical protein
MDCSVENGLEWLKQHWQNLGIFHYILHYIVYWARTAVIKMELRINFLVDGLNSITIWGKIAEF